MKKKISIITPCYNAEWGIKDTIASIINQRAVLQNRVELEYIIVDGLSTDRTVSIAEQLTAHLPTNTVKVISEPDRGMYDALQKGLQLATGDYCAYLNAGDYYNLNAFDAVADIFDQHTHIRWLTGLTVLYNEQGYIYEIAHPYRYRKQFIQGGLYGPFLPWIQQESTFWRTELLSTVQWSTFANLHCAGDFYLWQQFSTVAELHIAYTHLGGFRRHQGQISGNMNAYLAELRLLAKHLPLCCRLLSYLDRWIWKRTAPKTKKKWNRRGILHCGPYRPLWN